MLASVFGDMDYDQRSQMVLLIPTSFSVILFILSFFKSQFYVIKKVIVELNRNDKLMLEINGKFDKKLLKHGTFSINKISGIKYDFYDVKNKKLISKTSMIWFHARRLKT